MKVISPSVLRIIVQTAISHNIRATCLMLVPLLTPGHGQKPSEVCLTWHRWQLFLWVLLCEGVVALHPMNARLDWDLGSLEASSKGLFVMVLEPSSNLGL